MRTVSGASTPPPPGPVLGRWREDLTLRQLPTRPPPPHSRPLSNSPQRAFTRQLPGAVSRTEMLFQTQMLALVTGTSTPLTSPTPTSRPHLAAPSKVLLWDDASRAAPFEVSVRSPVLAIRLRHDALVLTTEHRTLAYALETFALLREVETIDNPRGLLSISVAADTSVFACPGLQRGHVRVEFLHDDSPYSPDDHDHKEDHDHHDRNHARTNHPHIMVADTDPDASTASITPSTSASASRPSVSPHSPRRRARFIPAHKSHLQALELSPDGSLLATCSAHGTLVRVFATSTGDLLHELRRGKEVVTVYNLAFTHENDWIAVASSSQTVHVFSLQETKTTTTEKNHPPPSNITSSRSKWDPRRLWMNTPTTPATPAPSPSPGINRTFGLPTPLLDWLGPALPGYFHSIWAAATYKVPGGGSFQVAFEKGNRVSAWPPQGPDDLASHRSHHNTHNREAYEHPPILHIASQAGHFQRVRLVSGTDEGGGGLRSRSNGGRLKVRLQPLGSCVFTP